MRRILVNMFLVDFSATIFGGYIRANNHFCA